MKATIHNVEVKDLMIPALETRQEHADGSVTYQGVYDVSLRIRVVGNDGDAAEFLGDLKAGTRLQSLQIAKPASKLRKKLTGIERGRKYVFE